MSEGSNDEIGDEPTSQQHEAGTSQQGAPQQGASHEGAPQQGAPWWQEPHSGPGHWSGHWSGHGVPGQPGPEWQGAAPGPQGSWPGHEAGTPGYGTPPYGSPGAPGAPGAHGYGGWGWGWGGHGGGWGGPPPGPTSPRPHRSRRLLAATAAGLLTVAAIAVGVGIGYDVWSGGTTPSAASSPRTGTPSGTGTTTSSTTTSRKTSSATGAPSDTATIAKTVDPGLVDVNTVLGYETEEAAGTGMVLTSTGKVLTNNHVIEGSTSVSVTDIGNGRTYSATVLGYDRTLDVAVIQLKDASGLKTVNLGNSASVKAGEPVVGIGNAGGTGGTPSVAGGSVTALNQSITASDQGSLGVTTEHLTGLIESNADIQPGDSGGPLVNTADKVVGMDTAASAAQGYNFSGAATGQGYSIPINTALATARQIIDGKGSSAVHIGGTGFLGVYVQTSTAATRARFTPTTTPGASTSGAASTPGALVAGVIAGTPAQRAGLVRGDVITSVAGTTVTSSSEVTKIMLQDHPGQKVQVTWTSSTGSPHSATLTLGNGPAD